MQGNRRRDTAPELALRSALHARGWRFRVQYPVPGAARRSIDVAFTKRRIAIFVDGCFWHGCPIHGSSPSTNSSYWSEKIVRNKNRDSDTNTLLSEAGWLTIRIWEHTAVAEALQLVERALEIPERSALGRQSRLVRLEP